MRASLCDRSLSHQTSKQPVCCVCVRSFLFFFLLFFFSIYASSYAKEGGHTNPGYIHRTGFNTFHFLDFTKCLKEMYYKDYRENYSAPIFAFQAYDTIGSVLPHIDEVNYAGLCCLNTDEEITGNISGTSFYRYKTGEEHTHQYSYRTEILSSSSQKDWNKYHTEYHQYNRFIFYESCIFHSAYWEESKWKSQHPRLTFNTFTW